MTGASLSDTIVKELQSGIIRGRYRPAQAIPTEAELQKRYGVSRITVRDAIRKLANQGLVVKQQGRGTFVSGSGIYHAVGFLFSHAEQMLARNYSLRTRVLQCRTVKADGQVSRHLGVGNGERVVYLERVRYVGEVPAQLIKSYLPRERVRGIESACRGEVRLHDVLTDKYRLRIRDAEELVEATEVGARDAQLMDMKRNTPALLVQRVTHLEDGTVIIFERILYRPKVIDFRIKIQTKWY